MAQVRIWPGRRLSYVGVLTYKKSTKERNDRLESFVFASCHIDVKTMESLLLSEIKFCRFVIDTLALFVELRFCFISLYRLQLLRLPPP